MNLAKSTMLAIPAYGFFTALSFLPMFIPELWEELMLSGTFVPEVIILFSIISWLIVLNFFFTFSKSENAANLPKLLKASRIAAAGVIFTLLGLIHDILLGFYGFNILGNFDISSAFTLAVHFFNTFAMLIFIYFFKAEYMPKYAPDMKIPATFALWGAAVPAIRTLLFTILDTTEYYYDILSLFSEIHLFQMLYVFTHATFFIFFFAFFKFLSGRDNQKITLANSREGLYD